MLRLDAIHAWLLLTRQSSLAKAIDYSLKRSTSIMLDDAASGNLPIDNNSIENPIRPIAIDKNCLSAGSEQGGKRAAAIQNLLSTANEMKSLARLKDTLKKTPSAR